MGQLLMTPERGYAALFTSAEADAVTSPEVQAFLDEFVIVK